MMILKENFSISILIFIYIQFSTIDRLEIIAKSQANFEPTLIWYIT